jgi:peptide/nickel transport system substrate-binding protein
MTSIAPPGIARRALLRGTAATALAAPFARSAAAAPDTLRAAISGYNVINTLDPAAAALIPEFYVIWALFNGLLKLDAQMQLAPELAESYKVAEDGSIEFKLRQGVTFHDGSPMTADDVKFSFERVMDEKTNSPNRSKLSAVSAIEVPDANTVRLHTSAPFAPLLTYLANARTGTQIVSRKAVLANPTGFGRAPVGTGAYKLQSWNPNEALKLAAHSGYFIAGQPRIPIVEMPLIAEETSGVTALLGRQVDMTSTAPFADVPALEKRSDI